ncbi:hypothetical protein J7E42_13280 [Bacillus sp. ISL-37]|nr:hypothetical protein [Bacillus sp. ISL-37]
MVEEEKLSELRATSDRFGVEREKAVRTKADFGQVWWWNRKSCQNKSKLRTGSAVKEEKLSEPENALFILTKHSLILPE